jgi:hypothetical protein
MSSATFLSRELRFRSNEQLNVGKLKMHTKINVEYMLIFIFYNHNRARTMINSHFYICISINFTNHTTNKALGRLLDA